MDDYDRSHKLYLWVTVNQTELEDYQKKLVRDFIEEAD